MASIVFGASPGNWSAGGSWVGGSAPGSGDDAVLHAASGACKIDTNVACRSLDCTGLGVSPYASTLTHNAAATLSIGTTTPGASNIALAFVAGMTYTLGNATTSAISFVSTNTTQQTIDAQGKTLGNVTFNGVGANWALISTLNQGSAATVELTAGTLHTDGTSDTSSLTHSWGNFHTTNSAARTLLLGQSSVTVQATGTSWNTANATNLTINAGTSTITLTGAGSIFETAAGQTFYSVALNGSGVGSLQGGLICTNLTRNGTAAKTDSFTFNNVTLTVTGALTLAGNSRINQLLVLSLTVGTQVTITNTGATMTITNCDFMDILMSSTWNASARTDIGDCGGNSGITFPAAVTQTWSGTSSGNWSTNAWTTRVPLSQDNVSLAVAFSASQTITADMPRLGANISWTGATGSPTWNVTSLNPTTIFGSVALITGMTLSTNITFTLGGRSSGLTITSAGKAYAAVTINAPSGIYTLQDALTNFQGNFSVALGTFNSNGFNVTAVTISTNTGSTINMSSSVWTLTSASQVQNWTGSGTVNAGTSTIVISTARTAFFNWQGSGKTYNIVQYNVPNSPGIMNIFGANTIATIIAGPGRTITFPSSTITTITGAGGFQVNGSPNGYLYLPSVGTLGWINVASIVSTSPDGDVTIDFYGALSNWSGTSLYLVAKRQTFFAFALHTSSSGGKLVLDTSPDGTTGALVSGTSTVGTGFASNALMWVRVSFQANDGSGNRVYRFYTSPDGSTWSQLGTTVTVPGTTSINQNTDGIEVGSEGSGAAGNILGNVYRARMATSDLGSGSGTYALDADFTLAANFGKNSWAEKSVNAATVTINGTLAQVGDGRVAITASTPGTQATLANASTQAFNINDVTIQDSKVTTLTPGYAGTGISSGNANISNNTNWTFGSAAQISNTSSIGISAALLKSGTHALSSTVSLSATLLRVGIHALASSMSAYGSIAKIATRYLTSQIAFVIAFIVDAPHRTITLSSSMSMSGALLKQGIHPIASSLRPFGSMPKTGTHFLVSQVPLSGALARKGTHALSSSIGVSGALTRHAYRVLAASITLSASLSRHANHVISATIGLGASLYRRAIHSILSSIGLSGNLRTQRPNPQNPRATFTSAPRSLQFTSNARSLNYNVGPSGGVSMTAVPQNAAGEDVLFSHESSVPFSNFWNDNEYLVPVLENITSITVYVLQSLDGYTFTDVTGPFLQGTSITGGVALVTVNTPGHGYSNATTATMSGGGGEAGSLQIVFTQDGTQGIAAINIIDPGKFFTGTPTIVINDPVGTGTDAVATATVQNYISTANIGNANAQIGMYYKVTFVINTDHSHEYQQSLPLLFTGE